MMKSADVAKQLAMLPQMHDHQLDLTVKELIEFGRAHINHGVAA